jgi:hypothetical protein
MDKATLPAGEAAEKIDYGNATLAKIIIARALEDIGPKIQKGDDVFIDIFAEPKPGQYVVTRPQFLELWNGQYPIHGVAIRKQRDL